MAERWVPDLKDILIAAPVIGGGIAMVYDVVCFSRLGIGFFRFFIIGAFGIFGASVPNCDFGILIIGMIVTFRKSPNTERYISSSSHYIGLGFMLLATLLIATDFSVSAAITFLIGCIMFFISPKITAAPQNIYILALAGMSFVAVFAVGQGACMFRLRGAPTENIEMADQRKIEGMLIRSGERGILFYDPKAMRTTFYQWDRIAQVER